MSNTMAIIVSLFRREFYPFRDRSVREAVMQFEAQLIALADLHRTMAPEAGNGPVSVDLYFETLCKSLCDALLAPRGIQCRAKIDAGFLPAMVCRRLGFIVAELVTNAMKHAFVGRMDGSVSVEMIRLNGRWFCTVSDDGVGVCVQGQGKGLDIVRTLARSINGEVIVNSGPGVSVTIILSGSALPDLA